MVPTFPDRQNSLTSHYFYRQQGKVIVVMREGYQVNSLSCIGVLPFIEGSLGDGTSGLVAVSRDSEEHA